MKETPSEVDPEKSKGTVPEEKSELLANVGKFLGVVLLLYTFVEVIFGAGGLLVGELVSIPFHLLQGQGTAVYTSTGSMKDFDAHDYPTVTIGSNEWMAADLSTGKFQDGSSIRQVRDIYEWEKACVNKEPVWMTIRQNDPNGSAGKLYNYYAVTDKRGLAPAGWHIPDSIAWHSLLSTLDIRFEYEWNYDSSDGEADAEILQSDTVAWKSPVRWFQVALSFDRGTNESGFSALPGGYVTKVDRVFSSGYMEIVGIGVNTGWWSSNGNAIMIGDIRGFHNHHQSDAVNIAHHVSQPSGFYVRCTRPKAGS